MKYFCRYIVFLIALCFAQVASAYGLKFRAADYPIDQRTSYHVFAGKCPFFKEYFEIEFNMALYSMATVGYVARIKDEEKGKIFNLFLDAAGSDALFRLNQEGKNVLIALPVDKSLLTKKDWFKVKMFFDLEKDEITLKVNEHERSCKGISLPNELRPEIVFGRSEHIIDVPAITIDSLRIKSAQTYDFPLDEVDGESVHDRSGVCYGKVNNPIWLVNEAYHWRKEAVFASSSEAGSCYDAVENAIYYLNSDSLFIYHVESGEIRSKSLAGRCPMKLFLASCFVDGEHGKLYVYEVFRESPFGKEPTVVSLDLQTLEWQVEGMSALNMQLHHHGSFFDSFHKRYTIFGGFGNMHYSDKFYQLNTVEGDAHWQELGSFSGDVICPRYFPSVGLLPEKQSAYVFGGMGNETGEQVVGRSYFHDFYKVDLAKMRVQKLWELTDEPNVVPARGMVFQGDSLFYVLRYRESISRSYLYLYQFTVKDGAHCQLGDSIPILSDKISTNANLYYSEQKNRLLVTVQESSDDVSSTFTIYTLLFPPVSSHVYDKVEEEDFSVIWVMIGLALGGIAAWWFRHHGRKKSLEEESGCSEGKKAIAANARIAEPVVFGEGVNRKNSIYLFGNFAVFDRNGCDISYMFSLRIRQALCFIIRYSNAEGISSKELGDRMWPDKPKDKVKNLRGVTINHLRKTLKELDGVELVCEKGNFRLVSSGNFYCDYFCFLQMVEENRVNVCQKELLNIVGRGKFLCFLENPLFDGFKEDVECSLEVIILKLIEESFQAEDYQMTVNLMEAEFNIDPVNEVALSHGIRSFYMLKQEKAAIAAYQKFVIEYKKSTGDDYSLSFMYYWRKS